MRKKLSGVRNEALDTSVYALAAAHLVGLTRIPYPVSIRGNRIG